MRTVIILLTVFILTLPSMGWAFEVDRKVVRIEDGDTFEFESLDPAVAPTHRCSMLGYDAPEGSVWNGGRWVKSPDPKAAGAANMLRKLILGKVVRIRGERTGTDDRWRCEVWLKDGTSVNRAMKAYLGQ